LEQLLILKNILLSYLKSQA